MFDIKNKQHWIKLVIGLVTVAFLIWLSRRDPNSTLNQTRKNKGLNGQLDGHKNRKHPDRKKKTAKRRPPSESMSESNESAKSHSVDRHGTSTDGVEDHIPPDAAEHASPLPDGDAQVQQPWKCRACTYLNQPELSQCEMCATAANGVDEQARAAQVAMLDNVRSNSNPVRNGHTQAPPPNRRGGPANALSTPQPGKSGSNSSTTSQSEQSAAQHNRDLASLKRTRKKSSSNSASRLNASTSRSNARPPTRTASRGTPERLRRTSKQGHKNQGAGPIGNRDMNDPNFLRNFRAVGNRHSRRRPVSGQRADPSRGRHRHHEPGQRRAPRPTGHHRRQSALGEQRRSSKRSRARSDNNFRRAAPPQRPRGNMGATHTNSLRKGRGITHVTSTEKFYRLLEKHSKVVVKFTASYCGPCKQIAPLYEEHARSSQHSDIMFLEVDVQKGEGRTIFDREGATSMPTFMFYKKRQKQDYMTIIGADENTLTTNVRQLSQL